MAIQKGAKDVAVAMVSCRVTRARDYGLRWCLHQAAAWEWEAELLQLCACCFAGAACSCGEKDGSLVTTGGEITDMEPSIAHPPTYSAAHQ